MSLIIVRLTFTCWLRSLQAWLTPSASLEKAASHGRSCSLLSYTCVVFNSCRAAATSFTLPSRAWKKTTFSDQTRVEGMILYKRPSSLCSVLLYLPLQQSLMSQSLAGGLFPLIQLLLLLLYPAVETLQTPLPFCTSAMDLLSATNLMRESQTVDESWHA